MSSWSEAVKASPGPKEKKDYIALYVKGFLMGIADLIPGVSGGTIALITGIYQNLIGALRSIDTHVVQKMLAFDIKGAVAKIHVRFLLALFSGIFVAILSLARLMNYLLQKQQIQQSTHSLKKHQAQSNK